MGLIIVDKGLPYLFSLRDFDLWLTLVTCQDGKSHMLQGNTAYIKTDPPPPNW